LTGDHLSKRSTIVRSNIQPIDEADGGKLCETSIEVAAVAGLEQRESGLNN
jgi:hypothetical protein